MATVTETDAPPGIGWNLCELTDRFGAIPATRVRMDPVPGTATEEDLIAIHDREDRLYELVDGVLVEKTMGWIEALLAMEIGRLVGNFVKERRLGVVVGPDGGYRIKIGMVRLPDVSFLPFERMPEGHLPRDPVCRQIPSLAVEVLSPSNSRKEMDRKLTDYFSAGVLLVWYVDPRTKTVRVYTSPETSHLLDQTGTLDGGNVLPGFTLRLADLFDQTPGTGPPA